MIEDKKIVFTTSWDDGSKFDLRLCNLFSKYNIRGTFYIPKQFELRTLSDGDIKEISKVHEIGAHTLTHASLTKISPKNAEKEIKESKEYLDGLLGLETKMFCYPRGFYNDEIKNIVKNVGFHGARTVKQWSFEVPRDFFEMETSLHIYPFPFRPLNSILQYKNPKNFLAPFLLNYPEIKKRKLGVKAFLSWQNLARASFLYARDFGGVFHIFGHSWEIEKYGMWRDLENFLKFVSEQENIIFAVNGELLDTRTVFD